VLGMILIKKQRYNLSGDEDRGKEISALCFCLRCGIKLSFGFSGLAWVWRGRGVTSHPRCYCDECTWKFVRSTGLNFEVCATGLSVNGVPDPYFGG
jgi:hypothetical protein